MSRDVKIQKGIPGHIGTDRFHTSIWNDVLPFFRTFFTGMTVLHINGCMPQANPTKMFI